uniref:PAK4-inhibitor INKA2 n=1 Tax=Periophthalmus magnuspinnatus TaxID=409849 RepID=A0A3B4B4P2_9GOBI
QLFLPCEKSCYLFTIFLSCLSMKEAGDGLHAQMNSMMGALQELKLLQVQTALENLDITGRPINRGIPHVPDTASGKGLRFDHSMLPETNPSPVPSLVSGNTTMSRESNCMSQSGSNDASDWTSSLMNQCRNRQPLVLGDNVFADLVGNWLDLPEVEREDMEEDEMRMEDAKNGNGISQEFCRKFTLTTNIFKKFLRSVRPDRDKLLKERPGWPEMTEADLFKRPKKGGAKVSKGSFYLPFWANGQQGKGSRQPQNGTVDRMPPLFDYNTAVWV